MNANELADELDVIFTTYSDEPTFEQAATMLRQLQAENKELKTMRGNSVLVPSDKLKEMQAEIEALKKEAALQRLSDFTQEADNEPVAWMNPKTLECGYGGDVDWEDTGCIPLYTKSQNMTLSEEEIMEIAKKSGQGNPFHIPPEFIKQFARAILRKASEK